MFQTPDNTIAPATTATPIDSTRPLTQKGLLFFAASLFLLFIIWLSAMLSILNPGSLHQQLESAQKLREKTNAWGVNAAQKIISTDWKKTAEETKEITKDVMAGPRPADPTQ